MLASTVDRVLCTADSTPLVLEKVDVEGGGEQQLLVCTLLDTRRRLRRRHREQVARRQLERRVATLRREHRRFVQRRDAHCGTISSRRHIDSPRVGSTASDECGSVRVRHVSHCSVNTEELEADREDCNQ